METHQVVGFLFNTSRTAVVLLEKKRPEWQAGKTNGVGGKCEEEENFFSAMEREFLEETGVLIESHNWERFTEMHFDNTSIHFFRAFADDKLFYQVKSKTDEEVIIISLKFLHHYNLISDLHWLIPMALYEKYPMNYGITCIGD